MAVITRRLKTLDFSVDGPQARVALPRQHFYMRLRFKVTLGTLSGGSSPAFTATAANDLIQRMELVIGGQLTVRNLSFNDLRKLNLLTYKDTTPSAGYAYMDLGFLPSFLFTSLDLIVTFAQLSTITTGSPTGTSGTTVAIYAREQVNVGQKPANVPLVIHKTLQADLSLKTGDQDIDIRDGQVLQALLVIPDAATTPDSLINSVSIVQDGIKFLRAAEPWGDLREENKADFELDDVQTKWAVVNFDVFGDGSQALRTKDMDTLQLRLNVNSQANGTVRLVLLGIQAA